MRLAFFALLCLNLAYFAWANWIDVPRPTPVNESIARLPRLKLVEELPPADRPQARSAQKTSLSPVIACLSVGPFAAQESSLQAADLLKTKGFEARQRTEPGRVSASYWVYVRALGQPEADAALVALERSGIGDARLLPESSEAGRRLSLGIYSERARAERRAEAVRRSGLNPEIVERRHTSTLYWLDLPAAPAADVPVQELAVDAKNPAVAVQPCPTAVIPTPAVTINTTATSAAARRQKLATAAGPAGVSADRPKLH